MKLIIQSDDRQLQAVFSIESIIDSSTESAINRVVDIFTRLEKNNGVMTDG